MTPGIRVHPEVQDALERGAAVVALESAVITSGLPREPLPGHSRLKSRIGEASDGPVNLELARAMERTVRDVGAIPATIAVIEGDLCIGLEDDELVMLATEKCAGKASVADLAALMASRATAGVTVSATLHACAILQSKFPNPKSQIRCFATGGIGGVHRDWQRLPDISADLRQIARTPACVVCSGAKSILDLPATLEHLESLGVPVIGYRTSQFPRFFSAGDDSLRLTHRADDAREIATICRTHWSTLGSASGMLLCNPPPEEFALPAGEIEAIIQSAEAAAEAQRIGGQARTPFLLAEIARLTRGRSLDANLALLLSNARIAAELARELSRI